MLPGRGTNSPDSSTARSLTSATLVLSSPFVALTSQKARKGRHRTTSLLPTRKSKRSKVIEIGLIVFVRALPPGNPVTIRMCKPISPYCLSLNTPLRLSHTRAPPQEIYMPETKRKIRWVTGTRIWWRIWARCPTARMRCGAPLEV